MGNVRMNPGKGTKRGRAAGLQRILGNHRPGMHHVNTGKILFSNISQLIPRGTTCAAYAHIQMSSKQFNTSNTSSNFFS